MPKPYLERKLAEVQRRGARLKGLKISKRVGLPFLMRPREAAAVLGVTAKELPAFRNLLPVILLDPKTPRYRTADVARLLLAELELINHRVLEEKSLPPTKPAKKK